MSKKPSSILIERSTTPKTKPLLFLIFLVTVIPTIYVYAEHAKVEMDAFAKAKTNETKKIKTSSEALFFVSIAIGYVLATIAMFIIPKSSIPYLVVIIGTVAIVILYYFRIYGIPIPFTEIVITDLSSDWRDVVTKICQQILVIPVTVLLIIRNHK